MGGKSLYRESKVDGNALWSKKRIKEEQVGSGWEGPIYREGKVGGNDF